jgi:hypothetical protein
MICRVGAAPWSELCRRGVRARSVGGRVRRQLCPHGGARGRVGSRTCGFVWDRACEICAKTRTEWTGPGLRPHPARVASPAHASLARHPVATDLTHSLPISLTLFAPTPSFPTLPSHADIHQGRRQNLHSQCRAIRHYRDPETEGKLRCGVRGAGEREMTAH